MAKTFRVKEEGHNRLKNGRLRSPRQYRSRIVIFLFISFEVLAIIIVAVMTLKTLKLCDDFEGNNEEDPKPPVAYRAGSTTQASTTRLQDDLLARRMSSDVYGIRDGRTVTSYTLRNKHMTVSVLNYGGIITRIMMSDKNRHVDDIVLGYDNLTEYERDPHLLGAIVGRYANMVASDTFKIDGDTYNLEVDRHTSGFSKTCSIGDINIDGDTEGTYTMLPLEVVRDFASGWYGANLMPSSRCFNCTQ